MGKCPGYPETAFEDWLNGEDTSELARQFLDSNCVEMSGYGPPIPLRDRVQDAIIEAITNEIILKDEFDEYLRDKYEESQER